MMAVHALLHLDFLIVAGIDGMIVRFHIRGIFGFIKELHFSVMTENLHLSIVAIKWSEQVAFIVCGYGIL